MNVIVETGTIKNREDGGYYPFEMCLLEENNIEEILNFQHEVLSTLENSEVCVYLSEFEVREILNGLGIMVGIYVNNTLAAYGTSLFPGEREDNLGRDINLTDEELMKVAHLESVAVHPAYRGNSLQMKIAHYLIKKVNEDGRCNYLMNTISPYNLPSLKITISLGFIIRKLYIKYGGVLRYLLFNDLRSPVKIDKETIITVMASDLEKQKELLQMGYYGISFEKTSDSANILFGKMVC